MNIGYDAVNYCQTQALYSHQVREAQHRVNRFRTTELVLYIDERGRLIDETTVKPNLAEHETVVQSWR